MFMPDASELSARARSDFRLALPIVIRNGDSGAVAISAETVREDRLAAMISMDGPTVLALTERRSSTLKARAYDGDIARVAVPTDADAELGQGRRGPGQRSSRAPERSLRN